MNTKRCCRCQEEKPLTAYHKQKTSLDGHRGACKVCRKVESKVYYDANREDLIRKVSEHVTRRYNTEPEYREKHLAYRRTKIRRARRNEINRERRRKDPLFQIAGALRGRLTNFVSGKASKTALARELLGCTLEAFKAHLEALFKPGMTWENYGQRGWHIDHIRPCISFNLLDPVEQRICFHYTNMQPLWATENLKKGTKIPDQYVAKTPDGLSPDLSINRSDGDLNRRPSSGEDVSSQ